MITWCLPTELETQIRNWAQIPDELWNSLCILHKQAITTLFNIDIARLERAEQYWAQRFKKE